MYGNAVTRRNSQESTIASQIDFARKQIKKETKGKKALREAPFRLCEYCGKNIPKEASQHLSQYEMKRFCNRTCAARFQANIRRHAPAKAKPTIEGGPIEFKIEKNIPIPTNRSESKYPFSMMVVGDSFFIKEEDSKAREKKRSAVINAARRHGGTAKFATRKVAGGIRIWRVK